MDSMVLIARNVSYELVFSIAERAFETDLATSNQVLTIGRISLSFKVLRVLDIYYRGLGLVRVESGPRAGHYSISMVK